MIGLDANVLLRFLAKDDARQSPIARQIMDRFTEVDPGFVSLVALAETVWVLSRVHGLSTGDLADAVESLLAADTLLIQNEYEVYSAVRAMRSGAGQFADALIAALGLWAGCATTLTFDAKASRLDGFTRV